MMMQLYLSKLEHVWFELHQHYHFSEPDKIFNILIAAYSEKQRAYHTVQHLYECLSLFELVKSELKDAHAVALALWFMILKLKTMSLRVLSYLNNIWLRIYQ